MRARVGVTQTLILLKKFFFKGKHNNAKYVIIILLRNGVPKEKPMEVLSSLQNYFHDDQVSSINSSCFTSTMYPFLENPHLP